MLVRKISAERARLEERLRQPVDPSAAPANVKKMPHARRAQPRDDTVKSVVILLFVFGCVAVVFAAHWARRAVNATKEAPANFTETVRRLYAQETTPDAYHPSSSQRDYVRTNLDEFVSLHREEMERLVDDALARFRAKKVAAGEPMSDGELAEAERSARILMASRFAKAWCELRGVA